jgi:hypothetical protein
MITVLVDQPRVLDSVSEHRIKSVENGILSREFVAAQWTTIVLFGSLLLLYGNSMSRFASLVVH